MVNETLLEYLHRCFLDSKPKKQTSAAFLAFATDFLQHNRPVSALLDATITLTMRDPKIKQLWQVPLLPPVAEAAPPIQSGSVSIGETRGPNIRAAGTVSLGG